METQKVVNSQIKDPLFIPHSHPIIYPPTNPYPSSPPLENHKLTHVEIIDH